MTVKQFETIIGISDATKVRVYFDREFIEVVIMISGNSRTADSEFIIVRNYESIDDWDFYTMDNHEIQTDENGDYYTEWVNEDFIFPVTIEDLLAI